MERSFTFTLTQHTDFSCILFSFKGQLCEEFIQDFGKYIKACVFMYPSYSLVQLSVHPGRGEPAALNISVSSEYSGT